MLEFRRSNNILLVPSATFLEEMVQKEASDLLVPVPQAEFRSSPGATVPEIIKLLKDSDGNVRQAAAKDLLQLSEQGKTVKLPNVTFLMTILAEFRPSIGPAIPEIVELLKHNGSEICETAANTLSQLSEQGRTAKLFNVALLMTIIAEFRPSIGLAIPEIVELLKHNGAEVRDIAAYTLSQLSEQGKTTKLFNVALLIAIIAEFRPLIATAILEFVKLLKDSDEVVRWGAKNTLSQFSEQGKIAKLSDVALLMTIIAEFRLLIGSAIPEIVQLLKHSEGFVREIAAYTLSQLSEQGKTAKLFNVALLMTIIAEFRPLIASAIPDIADLLKHSQAGIDVLSQLSKHGKTVNLSRLAFLMYTIAEFHPLISVIKRFEMTPIFNSDRSNIFMQGPKRKRLAQVASNIYSIFLSIKCLV